MLFARLYLKKYTQDFTICYYIVNKNNTDWCKAPEGRNNMCIENLFICLSCDCLVDIYQDNILLYTGDAYDIPIGLMNANIKEIKPVYENSIEIILAG